MSKLLPPSRTSNGASSSSDCRPAAVRLDGSAVAPDSSAEFSAAIERLSDRELHRQMCENIRQQSISSDELIREKLMAIYRE